MLLDMKQPSVAELLHKRGWVELPAVNREWDAVRFVEAHHRKLCTHVEELLSEKRHLWYDADKDGDEYVARPGTTVARMVTAQLALEFPKLKVWVSVTHPSVEWSESQTWENTGPRFYVSVLPTAMAIGVATAPPEQLRHVLWPGAAGAHNCWVTEMGWTLVPPRSSAQMLHADIVLPRTSDLAARSMLRHGRFHHLAWKTDGVSKCTTEVVSRAFTNGALREADYDRLEKVNSTCVILDSEMTHRGAAMASENWGSTCTIQLCSSDGWPVLKASQPADLIQYSLPLSAVARPLDLETKPKRKREADPNDLNAIALAADLPLLRLGVMELPFPLPAWEVFDFVEELHARFCHKITKELTALERVWQPISDGCRPGEFAAEQVTRVLKRHGVAVYAGPPSHSPSPPYAASGPRFYVSITEAARKRFGEKLPAMPAEVLCALWPRNGSAACRSDRTGTVRLRGLGWALAPPGSDPQLMHADIWCLDTMDTARFPHILWKRNGLKCTTEIVPGAFTAGVATAVHYAKAQSVAAHAVVMNSEMLHRGAAVLSPAWASTCSVELCSSAGWEAWEKRLTLGTTKPVDPADTSFDMLVVSQSTSEAPLPEVLATRSSLSSTPAAALIEEQCQWEAE